MVRCALCGRKIKRRNAVRLVNFIAGFGWEEEEVLYFCSEEHKKAWELFDHLLFFMGDLEMTKEHLVKMHGWSEEELGMALKTLKELKKR